MSQGELKALGAPLLPAGHFYRVSTDSLGVVTIEVRRSCRWGSVRVSQSNAFPEDVSPNPHAAIAALCKHAVDKAEKRLASFEYYAQIRALEGDHH